jgi:hypothetical protein
MMIKMKRFALHKFTVVVVIFFTIASLTWYIIFPKIRIARIENLKKEGVEIVAAINNYAAKNKGTPTSLNDLEGIHPTHWGYRRIGLDGFVLTADFPEFLTKSSILRYLREPLRFEGWELVSESGKISYF